MTSFGRRVLSARIRHAERTGRPSSSTFTALSRSPSAHASVASTMPQVPGVSAPRSRWCAVVAEKPTSSSPRKIGMTIATSG